MRRPQRPAALLSTKAFQVALALAAAACSPAQGGPTGPAAGPGYTGGLPGGICAPAFQNQGCASTGGQASRRVRCDKATGKWLLLADCETGAEVCVELPDPASPASMSKVSQCDKLAVAPADALTPDTFAGDVAVADSSTATDAQAVDTSGPKPALQTTVEGKKISSWTFVADPALPTPQQAVVRVTSTGTVDLILNKITLQSQNKFMELKHNDGTLNLPASVAPGSHIELTVRYVPVKDQIDLAPATLRVIPSHDIAAQAKVGFSVEQKKTGLMMLCDGGGAPSFSFDGTKKVKFQKTCTVVNQTGAAAAFDSWSLVAKQPSQGGIVQAIFGLDVYTLDQNGQKLVQAPFTLEAGLKMVFAVTFYPPADGKVADATLVAPWNQSGNKAVLTIPVHALPTP